MRTEVRPRSAPAGPPVVRPPAGTTRPGPGARRPSPVAGPRPDPRIAARRIAVRRDEGRRRLRRLLAVAAVAVAVAAGALATRTPLLDVDHVRVRGTERLSVEAVRAALAEAGIDRGEPLLDVDEADAARALEALPHVAEARVARDWPGSVVVTVVERRPVGVVAVGDEVAVVAGDGVVLDVRPAAPAGLPELEGASAEPRPGASAEGEELLAVAAALPAGVARGVAAVVAAEGGTVDLRLLDGLVAHLGPPADLEAKLTALVTVLANVDPACVGGIDVRVPTAPAVTEDQRCAG